MKQIMVFGDGETYADLNGCVIVSIPDDWDAEQIEEALGHLNNGLTSHIDPVIEQSIKAMTMVGQKTRDQLVEANCAEIVMTFGVPS